MKAVTKMLAVGVGFAALAGAAPAAAQYYPGYPGYGSGGGLGAIIDAIIGAQRYGQYGNQYGYGQYGYGYNQQQERFLVEQCARATESQLQRRYGGYNYGGYGQYGYNNYGAQARIVAITNLQRRSNGRLQIYGTATSGRASYQQPYGGYGYGYNQPYGGYGYNQPYTAADLRFDCTVDYRGRVTDVDIERNRYR